MNRVDEPSSPPDAPTPPAMTIAPRAARPLNLRSGRSTKWRQRLREFMRRDNLREFGTTLALVAPLTVLIWVWAEREQTVPLPYKGQFTVSLRSSNPAKSITIDQGRSDTVVVELTGPRAGMEALKDAVIKDRSRGRLVVDIGDPPEGGALPVTLDSYLNQQKIFREYGVTVLGTEPAALPVYVDRQIERDLPIRASRDLQDVVQSMTASPASVKVRGPERAIRALEQAGTLVAELDLGGQAQAIRSAAPGAKLPYPNVPIRPIDGAPTVVFDATTVASVTLERSQDETIELKSVAVYLNKPAALESHVSVTVTPTTLTNVKIAGPRDVLEKLQREEGDAKPYAVLTVTRNDLGKPGRRTPVLQNLPPGVRVVEGSIGPIDFEVIEATAADDLRPVP